jgi:hypothetical protein
MARRLGLDAGSRDVLLDLIYRLSLDDKKVKGGGKDRGEEAQEKREKKQEKREQRNRERGSAEPDDDDVSPEAAREHLQQQQRDRVKDARRAEKQQDAKEKVLRKALKEDRRNAVGANGGGGESGSVHPEVPGLASQPFEAGSLVNVSITSTAGGGETKVMSIKRGASLDALLTAAKSKLKLKKKPLSAKMHPGGQEIGDTLRLEPMAVVAVSPDPPSVAPPSKSSTHVKGGTSADAGARAGEDDVDGGGSGGGGGEDADDGDDDDDAIDRLRSAMAARAAAETRRGASQLTRAEAIDESARLLSLLRGGVASIPGSGAAAQVNLKPLNACTLKHEAKP